MSEQLSSLFLKNKFHYFANLFLLLLSFLGEAQEYDALAKEEKLSQRLQSYVLVDLNTFPQQLLATTINTQIPIAVILAKDKQINHAFSKKYLKLHKKVIVISDLETDPALVKNIPFLKITTKHLETLNIVPHQLNDSAIVRFNSTKELSLVHFKGLKKLADSTIINLWKHSGKLPNFIKADSTFITAASKMVKLLNSRQKAYGVVKTKTTLLNDVSFKNEKNQKANGYFCFPYTNNTLFPILIPHKAGYYFSPDIIYTSIENFSNSKEFIGFPLEPEFGLSDHFLFDTKIENTIRKNNTELLSNGIIIKEDPQRGKVALFNKEAYIDAGLESRKTLQSSFSITAWIKPTAISFNNSILGKGDNFVLKLHEGALTFTMAGIKDYVSESSPIPLQKWTHIALVHSKIDNDLKFFINGKQTDRIELIADYITTDYNLLIGSNLWQEYFIGYINEIKIWERELNSNEISKQFLKTPEKPATISTVITIGIVLLIAITIGYLILINIRTRKKRIIIIDPETDEIVKIVRKQASNSNHKSEQILCLGALKIIDKEHIDVAKKLSPKLKKLFILIFLHSYGEKKGISTKKITELLWPGMSLQSAKNTRGTNVQNLKSILSSTSIRLVFEDKLWILKIPENYYCDYQIALNYLSFFSKENNDTETLAKKIPNLLLLLKEGRFLINTSDVWLDPYIEKFSNLVIEQCTNYTAQLTSKKHGSLLLDIAEIIYLYDDLNEKALQLKLEVLIHQGKLSLAHTVHDNFSKLYQKLYKEPYHFSFEELVSQYQTQN